MAQIVLSKLGLGSSEANGAGEPLRVRQDVRYLQNEYNKGNKKPLSDLLRAWKGIQELPYTDFQSFFTIAGYHGEPFRGAGWGNPQWWGGYCNHGNVLFPTWHRAYLHRIENALRSIPGCEEVTLPYWDEAGVYSVENVLPEIFLWKQVELDTGDKIDNPLYSYKYQHQISDNLTYPEIVDSGNTRSTEQPVNPLYFKTTKDKTVRYPFSGFDDTTAQSWNALMNQKPDAEINTILSTNVWNWINEPQYGVRQKYLNCLKAPTYTVFSNTTSAQQWNFDHPEAHVVPVESPHNDMHLAVGGFHVASDQNFDQADFSQANGDMGENNTASFDPIFFFHHCFVDKTFWDWQVLHKNSDGSPCTDKLEVEEFYPGTNSVDNQGPTPGVAGGSWLDLDAKLLPFKKGGETGPVMTSMDVVNITTQLNYSYDQPIPSASLGAMAPKPVTHHAVVSGINRGTIAGSFMVAAYKEDVKTKERTVVGQESILSRWATSGCANCQNHLQVKAHFPLHGLTEDDISGPNRKYDIVSEVIPRKINQANTSIPKPNVVAVKLAPVTSAGA